MIVDIDRERILNFDNHPFKITDDENMIEEKPNQKERFSIKYEDLRKYFPKNYSNEQIYLEIINGEG